jgi:hypothetical protein
MSNNTQICIKSKCRQALDRNLATTNNPAITQNNAPLVRRPVRKNKPISYKEAFKQRLATNPNAALAPPFSQRLRDEYLRRGQLTNAHKRFLNLVSNQVINNKGCTSCSKAIKGLAL